MTTDRATYLREWKVANRDKVHGQYLRRRMRDLEKHRRINREAKARYRVRHPERVKESYRKCYEAHADEYRRRKRERQKTTPYAKARRVRTKEKWRTDPQFRAKQQDANRQWAQRNREKTRAYGRTWAATNKEKIRMARRRARGQHPEEWRLRDSRKRALRALAKGTHTSSQWLHRVAFYGWLCAYCQRALNEKSLTKDHVFPLSRGGADWASNLVPACKSCNSRKRNRPQLPTLLRVGGMP